MKSGLDAIPLFLLDDLLNLRYEYCNIKKVYGTRWIKKKDFTMGLGHKTLKVALRFLDIFKLKLCLQEIYKKNKLHKLHKLHCLLHRL